jgi:hypothetical protein
MLKTRLLLFILLGFATFAHAQTLLSPDAYLGYKLGSKFTAHHKIVAYFEAVANAVPQQIKLEKYGQTNEGRPLMLAIISAPENMLKIEDIRKNNIRLTGLLNDKPADVNAPAIVWLSYNVHGNETSSSEVSMKVLYELLSGKNTSLNEWMKNTVVIIDPCLNPDGRDRYVNWLSQVSGKFPNADVNAREHDEPWPGGRSNHYNYDLNRDWAWQTQVESQTRLYKYQQWMPQIHCDFHEQSPNAPYYFAPAAEPVHEAVTQWQKDFQVTVGKNHAKYFDANGWLFFTKQYFDLFYPSYGDTYPLFNGSIGMTYEQGGGPRGGVAVALENGDTLTLEDRIAHHFSTSISTIEAASTNANKLVSNFKNYFDESNAGKNNVYKSYVVKNGSGNIDALQQLLQKNKIQFAFADIKAYGNARGYNYFNQKEETFTIQKNDLVINAAQPKAALLKVLFEPQPKLNDSATYDITAWALPYAYGLQSYASKEIVASSNIQYMGVANAKLDSSAYGYVVPYNSLSDTKLMSALLDENVKLRFAESAFANEGVTYNEGSLLVFRKGNGEKLGSISKLFRKFNSSVGTLSSGFSQKGFDAGSDRVHFLKNPRVALITGEGVSSTGAGEVWHFFEQELNKKITLVNASEFNNTDFKDFNTIILPDGNYKFLNNKDAAAGLRQWIKDGGRLIALENSVKQIAGLDWGLKIKKAQEDKTDTALGYIALKKYADREKESVANNIPGAIYKMEIDNTHPLGYGYPNFYHTLKLNDNAYEFLRDGWNVGTIKKTQPVAGFVGSKVKQNLKDAVLLGELPIGKGSVVFFADDPLFRSFWENGKMLFCNALFFTGQ